MAEKLSGTEKLHDLLRALIDQGEEPSVPSLVDLTGLAETTVLHQLYLFPGFGVKRGRVRFSDQGLPSLPELPAAEYDLYDFWTRPPVLATRSGQRRGERFPSQGELEGGEEARKR